MGGNICFCWGKILEEKNYRGLNPIPKFITLKLMDSIRLINLDIDILDGIYLEHVGSSSGGEIEGRIRVGLGVLLS